MATRSYRTTLGEAFTEGARLVWTRLEKEGIDPGAFAAEMGWARSTVWRLLYGDRRPGYEIVMRLEKRLGVAPAMWQRPPARPFVLPAIRAANSAA